MGITYRVDSTTSEGPSSASFATDNHSGRFSTLSASIASTKRTTKSSRARHFKTRISNGSRRRSSPSTKGASGDAQHSVTLFTTVPEPVHWWLTRVGDFWPPP